MDEHEEDDEVTLIQRVLAGLPVRSRSVAHRLILQGAILVDGRPVRDVGARVTASAQVSQARRPAPGPEREESR